MAHGGARKGSGRKPGSTTKKTREIADRAAREGVTPLEVMLEAMRALWKEAKPDGSAVIDPLKAKAASDIAKDCAPYMHPRLSNIEANVSVSDHEQALAELE